MCIDIVEIRFGIVNGQIRVICPRHAHMFLDNNLSKCQRFLTNFGRCIDIKEIWFGIANGQISSILTELPAHDRIMAGYYSFTFLFLS